MKDKPRGLTRLIRFGRDRWGDFVLTPKPNHDLRRLEDAQKHERAWLLRKRR